LMDLQQYGGRWSREVARWPWGLRFHFPLVEPDVRICRIRLSDKASHAFAHGVTLGVIPERQAVRSIRPNLA
jgi:hypothetical protein